MEKLIDYALNEIGQHGTHIYIGDLCEKNATAKNSASKSSPIRQRLELQRTENDIRINHSNSSRTSDHLLA